MSTVAEVVDRLFAEYLAVVDDQPSTTTLTSSIDSSTTSVVIDTSPLTPEEQALVGVTTHLEIGSEMMRVTDFNETTSTATVVRAALGTTAAAHTSGDDVRIQPNYTRHSALKAIGDVVARLYPTLWGVRTEFLVLEAGLTQLPDAARGVISLMDTSGGEIPFNFRPKVGELDDAPALLIGNTWDGYEAWVTYRHGFTKPGALTDELTSSTFGLDAAWDEILIVGAASKLLAGKEFDRATLEFLSEALEAQGFRLGEITNVSTALLRYQGFLLQQASSALAADYEVSVTTARVI